MYPHDWNTDTTLDHISFYPPLRTDNNSGFFIYVYPSHPVRLYFSENPFAVSAYFSDSISKDILHPSEHR